MVLSESRQKIFMKSNDLKKEIIKKPGNLQTPYETHIHLAHGYANEVTDLSVKALVANAATSAAGKCLSW